jgi:glycosyltransferase involved in cell wall biosynthesis
MNVLFVHNNFPAQFRHIASHLAADPNNLVAAIGSPTAQDLPNVILRRYCLPIQDVTKTHPFARRFDLECRRAEQVLYTATELASSGFYPDVIMVHSGWGENLPLRSVFPAARIATYCEFYYRPVGQDVNFDPEFPRLTIDGKTTLSLKNASQLFGLIEADIGISPTAWQRSTFPPEVQHKIVTLHEGIDTRIIAPSPEATFATPSGKLLRKGDEVITYVSRDLEPLRGYHSFMRSLPNILRDRPNADVLIVGGDKVSYGPAPPRNCSWKEIFLKEVESELDTSRIHFLGNVAYEQFLAVLQVSAVHVYLTYPFVLSWSFLEAMSAGCVIVTSDVPPTREILDESCGLFVAFHDVQAIAAATADVLSAPHRYAELGVAARKKILAKYDLATKALPAFARLLSALAQGKHSIGEAIVAADPA